MGIAYFIHEGEEGIEKAQVMTGLQEVFMGLESKYAEYPDPSNIPIGEIVDYIVEELA